MEWEDSRVVEYAKQCNQPEHFASEDFAKVAEFEFFFRSFFFEFASSFELFVEFAVHDNEYEVEDETNHKQYSAKQYRSRH